MKTYTRNQLPQWNVINLIHLDYTFYFGLAHPNELIPSQPLANMILRAAHVNEQH